MGDVRIITTRDTKDTGKVGTVVRESPRGQLVRVRFADGHEASFWRFEVEGVDRALER